MALEDRLNTANPGTDFADYGIDNNFWQNAYSWEPKKKHQFIMEIEGIPAYLIKSANKPSLENGEITLDHINVQRYVKGKSKWNTLSISLWIGYVYIMNLLLVEMDILQCIKKK